MPPLARLLLRAAAHCPSRPAVVSAAHTAAWALSNLLWGVPTQARDASRDHVPRTVLQCCAHALLGVVWQAGPLLDVPGFRDGLVLILKRQHDARLQEESAWLLAFLSAGPEAHMHAVVKHGAAEVVAATFVAAVREVGSHTMSWLEPHSNAAAGHMGFFMGAAQQEEVSGVWPSEALLAPLLRCMGNMASSKAAAVHFTRTECVAAATRCADMSRSGLRGEALWVLDYIAAAAGG